MSEVLARFVPGRGKLAVTFLGLLMFTAAAVYLLMSIDLVDLEQVSSFMRLALWAVLVLCPVFAADTLARLVRRTPTLLATPEGLVLRSIIGFSAPIPWREIGAVRAAVMGKKPWLAIYLDDPVATFSRMSTWSRLMHAKSHAVGVPNIAFRAIHLGVSPADAAGILEQIRRERQAA